MKQLERGFTLIELLMVTAILGLIVNGATMSIYQVLKNTERNRNQMTAVSQVQNAGYWVSLDAQRAQTVDAEGLGGGGMSIVVSWQQSESGSLEESGQYTDTLYFALSGNSGSSWSDWETAFTGDNPPGFFSQTIPSQYITNSFSLRFYLNGPYGWVGGDEYAYIDNIIIAQAILSDDCSSFDDWNNGNDWDIYSGQFRGHHYNDPSSNRDLTMSTTQDLSSYQGETVTISWTQNLVGDIESTDGLYFAFSSDNGSTWGSDIEAFHYHPPSSFSHTIPEQYLTDGFRMRFYLDDTRGGDEYLYIDDITISIPIWSDGCSNFNNWDNGSDWDISSGEFRGQHYNDPDSNRYLTMDTSVDLTSQTFAVGFPLTFTWVTWSESGGTEHQVIYSIVDGRLIRSCSIDSGTPTETLIARCIDSSNTGCCFANGKLTLKATATVGDGPMAMSETREFQVLTRPD